MEIWIRGNSSPRKKEETEVKEAVGVVDREVGSEGPSSPTTSKTKKGDGSEGSSKERMNPEEKEAGRERKRERKKKRVKMKRK